MGMSKRHYKVWFELFGKKMKATVFATDENEAKHIIRNKIIIRKVEQKESMFDNLEPETAKIMDILGIKKP